MGEVPPYRVSGFRLQVSGVGFPHLLARWLVRGREVSCCMFRVPSFGFWVSGFMEDTYLSSLELSDTTIYEP